MTDWTSWQYKTESSLGAPAAERIGASMSTGDRYLRTLPPRDSDHRPGCRHHEEQLTLPLSRSLLKTATAAKTESEAS